MAQPSTEAITTGSPAPSQRHDLEIASPSRKELNKFDNEAFVKVPPLDFCFDNIKYSVEVSPQGLPLPCFRRGPKQHKTILHGLSGRVRAGESLAILGSSGAGKSSLLDILASRVKRNAFEGVIKINDDPDIKRYKHLTAYVPQADSLFPDLTVEESLLYSARLRLPLSMTDEEKQARVANVIKILGLTKCKDTKVGNETEVRGVSGGERRRTSIGMELVTAPSLMFLDEATSGLDSYSALNVVEILSALTRQGRTIVLTIHQPSSTIFRSFDNVMFLADGYIVYYGPPMKAVEYFSRLSYQIPENTNPADFVLEVTNTKAAKGEIKNVTSAWETEGQQFIASLQPTQAPIVVDKSLNLQIQKPDRGKFGWQLLILTRRTLLLATRTPAMFFQFISMYIIVALVLGTLYFQNGHRWTETYAHDVLGCFAFMAALSSFTQLAALPVFLEQKAIFKRERGSAYFKVLPYVMSLTIVQMPLLVILALLVCGISYFLVGLAPDPGAFFFTTWVVWTTLFVAQSFALMLSAIFPNFGVANAVASSFFAFSFLFSGAFIIRTNIPSPWIWFYYISNFQYSITSNALTFFLNSHTKLYLRQRCDSPYYDVQADPTCYFSGYEFLSEQGMITKLDRWALLGILLFFGLFYRTVFYLLLRFVHKPQRK